MLTIFLIVVAVRGSRLAPNLDLSSVIPDAWVTAAFYGAPVCAILAAGLGVLAVIRFHQTGYGTSVAGHLAHAGLVLGLLAASITMLGVCSFLSFALACNFRC
jgi:hypothetical protein